MSETSCNFSLTSSSFVSALKGEAPAQLVDQLQGEVVLVRAADGAHYDGIGKSSVNIQHLPVLKDELGYFGSPTSDSQRAMIQPGRPLESDFSCRVKPSGTEKLSIRTLCF